MWKLGKCILYGLLLTKCSNPVEWSVERASVGSAYTVASVNAFHTSAAASVSESQRSGDVS